MALDVFLILLGTVGYVHVHVRDTDDVALMYIYTVVLVLLS